MVYVPITYIPDGPVTRALKREIRGRKPKPQLGNLGPLLDENYWAAKKHQHFRFHPAELRRLPGVEENPHVVDEGFDLLRALLADEGIAEPASFTNEAPYSSDVPRVLKLTLLLAVAMTVGITLAVLLGQNDSVAAMTVAIVLISLAGAGLFMLILSRCVIHVSPQTGDDSRGRVDPGV